MNRYESSYEQHAVCRRRALALTEFTASDTDVLFNLLQSPLFQAKTCPNPKAVPQDQNL